MHTEMVPLPDDSWDTKEALWRQGHVICADWEYTASRVGTARLWMEATPPFSIDPQKWHRDGIHPVNLVSVPAIGLFVSSGDRHIEEATHDELCELWDTYVIWDGYQEHADGRALRALLQQRFRVYETVYPAQMDRARYTPTGQGAGSAGGRNSRMRGGHPEGRRGGVGTGAGRPPPSSSSSSSSSAGGSASCMDSQRANSRSCTGGCSLVDKRGG